VHEVYENHTFFDTPTHNGDIKHGVKTKGVRLLDSQKELTKRMREKFPIQHIRMIFIRFNFHQSMQKHIRIFLILERGFTLRDVSICRRLRRPQIETFTLGYHCVECDTCSNICYHCVWGASLCVRFMILCTIYDF
jgi:hypothetical protein